MASSNVLPLNTCDRSGLKSQMRAAAGAQRFGELARHLARTLDALIDLWQPAGLWAQIATIARRAGYSYRRAHEALRELRRLGLLVWERRWYQGNQTSNLYAFTPLFWSLVHVRQTAAVADSRRQPLPTNGSLINPVSSKQEGEPTRARVARELSPSRIGKRSEERPSEAAAELARVFRAEHAERFPRGDAGTALHERTELAAGQLDGLAAEAVAWAAQQGQRVERRDVAARLTVATIAAWLGSTGRKTEDEPRGVLVHRGHAFGLFVGDVARFGLKALDAWKVEQREAAKRVERAERKREEALPDLRVVAERMRELTSRIGRSMGRLNAA